MENESSGKGNGECKGPEAEAWFVNTRNREQASVAGAGNGRKNGDEVRGNRHYDLQAT